MKLFFFFLEWIGLRLSELEFALFELEISKNN